MARLNRLTAILPLAALLLYRLYVTQLQRELVVLGVFRTPNSTAVAAREGFVVVEGTTHCEDMHYYEPSNELFAACEGVFGSRREWFPPIEHLNFTGQPMKGQIVVIDAKTQKSRSLVLEGFDSPFVTHGIDIIPDPETPQGKAKAVYIFAVNHPPNPEHYTSNGIIINAAVPKARSVIEVFHHVIGSDKAKHVRTVWHPLITTPNDIFAVSPRAFFVTNDHFYREGFMRAVEAFYYGADWANTVYVEFDMSSTSASVGSDGQGVVASVVIDGLHNNNGLSHGRTPDEVFISQAASGVLNIGRVVQGRSIDIKERIFFNSIIDNPSYFSDPFADEELDASGLVNCGLAQGIHFDSKKGQLHALEPSMVWKSSPKKSDTDTDATEGGESWETELVFEDDGRRIRTCSSAVMVAIDPKEEGGRRRAWLYATGYWSTNMIAVKVDL